MNSENDFVSNIWNKECKNLNKKDSKILLEQYKIYVIMANHISERRDKTNSFFLTLNSLIIAGLGFSYEKVNQLDPKALILFPVTVIIVFCIAWLIMIFNYRNLNSVKFRIICEIEKKLFCTPWGTEWMELGEGKDKYRYISLTTIELAIPIVFMLLYLIISYLYITN